MGALTRLVRLVLGAVIFGVGWGLAGFCPGPALVAAASGSGKAVLFVGAMLAGMGIFELTQSALSYRRSRA